jgi:hypothetical protein
VPLDLHEQYANGDFRLCLMSKYAAAAPIPLAMLKLALQVIVKLSASAYDPLRQLVRSSGLVAFEG